MGRFVGRFVEEVCGRGLWRWGEKVKGFVEVG